MHKNSVSSAKSNRAKLKQKVYSKRRMIISDEDFDWALQQKPAVYTLWGECWRADPYGSRMMQLNTTLPRSTFMMAKKVLSDAGLFIFNRKTSTRDGRETVCWEVQNLHGARAKDYWEELSTDESTDDSTDESKKESHQQDALSHKRDVVSHRQDVVSHSLDSISSETLTEQAFQKPSLTSHKHLTNSSKELVRCENPVSSENLVAHLEAAVRGVLPSKGIIYQLRDSRYWVNFTGAARVHGWDLRELLAED